MSVTVGVVKFTPDISKILALAFVNAGGDVDKLVSEQNEQINNPDREVDDTKSDDDAPELSLIGGLLTVDLGELEFKCENCSEKWVVYDKSCLEFKKNDSGGYTLQPKVNLCYECEEEKNKRDVDYENCNNECY
jgi:hypothetical protein